MPPARFPAPPPAPSRWGLGDFRAGLAGRALAALTWAAVGAVVLAFLLMVVGPRAGLYHVSVVLSDSMKPAWEAGDLVVSTSEPTEAVRAGQAITFTAPEPGRPSITHRVVRVVKPGPAPIVLTKGDANSAPDPWGPIRLRRGEVWRVRAAVPQAGWALAFLNGRAVAFLTTVLAPIALLGLLLRRIWARP